MIYRLPSKLAPELEANLRCLQDCRQTEPVFARDLKRFAKLMNSRCVQEAIARE